MNAFDSKDGRRHAIQAGKPIEPWERPGCFRLDCEPHRGSMIHWMGRASLALGLSALVPCLFGMPALLGVPLGFLTWHMARHDVAEMRAGRMDPGGEVRTLLGLDGGMAGLVMGLLGAIGWGSIAFMGDGEVTTP